MIKQISGVLLVLFFLGGCAISPQSIQLNPSVTVPQSNMGQGRSINLTVVDQRKVKALGSRGGIYARTALVTIDGGPEEPIRQELAGALSGYGFNVINAVNADINLNIDIETLGYESVGNTFPKQVKNNILLKATCTKNGSEFSSRYAANKVEELLVEPTAGQNERMINSLVSRGLSALMTDQRLLDFLR